MNGLLPKTKYMAWLDCIIGWADAKRMVDYAKHNNIDIIIREHFHLPSFIISEKHNDLSCNHCRGFKQLEMLPE